eukprot:359094-Chlamydomonas_euryale.AAC.5
MHNNSQKPELKLAYGRITKCWPAPEAHQQLRLWLWPLPQALDGHNSVAPARAGRRTAESDLLLWKMQQHHVHFTAIPLKLVNILWPANQLVN